MIGRLSHRTVVVVDLLLLGWLLLFVWVGFSAGRRVDALGGLGDGLISAGSSIVGVAGWIDGLGDIPLIGEGISAVAGEIEQVGQSTITRGEEGKAAVRRMAVSLGAVLALAPTLPLLVTWAPIRVLWHRDRSAVHDALARGDANVMGYLAHRVVGSVPYRRLATVSPDPFGDLNEGRYERLARLELDRLGIRIEG